MAIVAHDTSRCSSKANDVAQIDERELWDAQRQE